jgi:hypothetical protein
VSAPAMLRAMIDGEADPFALAGCGNASGLQPGALPYSGSCGRHYPISGRTQLFTWSECAGVCGGLQQEVLRGVPAVSLRLAGSFMKSPQRHRYDDEYLRSFR